LKQLKEKIKKKLYFWFPLIIAILLMGLITLPFYIIFTNQYKLIIIIPILLIIMSSYVQLIDKIDRKKTKPSTPKEKMIYLVNEDTEMLLDVVNELKILSESTFKILSNRETNKPYSRRRIKLYNMYELIIQNPNLIIVDLKELELLKADEELKRQIESEIMIYKLTRNDKVSKY
jgi:hypothetical protein